MGGKKPLTSTPEETSTPEDIPGACVTLKQKLLESGSNALQPFKPINNIHTWVCGFHFYSGDIKRVIEAHHYCSHISSEVHQCVIYEGPEPNARLIGVEYIISENIFKTLPEEEKKYWHSHKYEVQSGMLVAPHLPRIAEKELMKELVNTYGKTIHTWQPDRGDTLPLGPPQIMMAFTEDGQLPQELIEARDKRLALSRSTAERRKERADIKGSPVAPGADHWQDGPARQLTTTDLSTKSRE